MLSYMERGGRKKVRGVKAVGVLYLSAQPRRGARVALESTQLELSLSERKYSRLPCPSVMSSDHIPKHKVMRNIRIIWYRPEWGCKDTSILSTGHRDVCPHRIYTVLHVFPSLCLCTHTHTHTHTHMCMLLLPLPSTGMDASYSHITIYKGVCVCVHVYAHMCASVTPTSQSMGKKRTISH